MTWLLVLIALLLPWLTGAALLYSAAALMLPRTAVHAPGELFWRLGAGAFLGYWLVTCLMRLYALLGIPFGLIVIAVPLLLTAVLAVYIGWRRAPFQHLRKCCVICSLPKLTRYLFWALLAWLALRFGLLFFEVSTRPLFPWEASIQWASKARVYFGLKSLAPFVDSAAWFGAAGNAYFDNAPNLAATLPLLQAWMCIAIGEWNDVLMNLPWWIMLLALTLAVYGFMRNQGIGAFASLITAWLVASLPLLNAHTALAGLPDLPLAGTYTLAALSLLRWARSRQWLDLFCTLLFALIAATLWSPAYLWLVTLLPALVCVLLPKSTRYWALALPTVTIAALLLLTQVGGSLSPALANLHLDTDPDAWLPPFIIKENWHFVWLAALATVVVGFRECLNDKIAPFSLIVLGAALIAVVAVAFPALVSWLFGPIHAERFLITAAPLLPPWIITVWHGRFRSGHHPDSAATE
ncbi:MAG: hypothetical protein LBE75_07455 [Burkholderiales bacterium]|jgi:hypothetical protein|nr:hypothetical protein [Burkholderiales bacterium]